MPYATNNGVRIHYEIDGSGPPLVLQHGFSSSLDNWYKNGYVQELRKDYKLILVDARGHGKSDKLHSVEDYRPDIVAKDYTAILDELGIEKTHFFGYSMGGRIGFQSLARHALSRFSSLVIGGATPYGTRTEAERQEYAMRLAALKLGAEKGMDAYIANFYEKAYGPMPAADRAEALKNDPKALYAIRQAYEEWPSAEDILSKLRIPCLVFCGGADPRFEMAEECVKHIPGAVFVPFPGLGHIQVMVRSDLVLPHVKRFLAGAAKSGK